LKNTLNSIDWQAWLIPLIWVLGILIVISFVRGIVCPKSGRPARTISYVFIVLVGALAIGILGGAILLHVERDTYRAFVGNQTIIVCVVFGCVLLCFASAMAYGLIRHKVCILRIGFWLLVLLTICEVLFALLCIYWVYSLGLVPSDALDSLFGNARKHLDDFLGTILDQPVALAEGLVCKTYQTCCFTGVHDDLEYGSAIEYGVNDRGFDGGADDIGSGAFNATVSAAVNTNQTTCLAQHEGTLTDVEITLRDPSTPAFCAYTSGAPQEMLVAPPNVTCTLLDHLASSEPWSLANCRRNFCEQGTDGYLEFVNMFVNLLQKYAIPLAAGFATLVILQMVLACNLRNSANAAVSRRAKKKDVKYVDDTLFPTYSERV